MKRCLMIIMIVVCLNLLLSNEILDNKSYKIINSDKVLVNKSYDNYVMNLQGNVHFFYGDFEFYCDNGIIIEETETAKMIGNVTVLQDTLKLVSEFAFYDKIHEEVKLKGHVKVYEYTQEGILKREFRADSLNYLKRKEEFIANKNVEAFEYFEKYQAKCGYLEYRRNDGYGFMKINPEIESFKDTVLIKSQKMEYFEDFSKIVASFNVETSFPDAEVSSDFLIYYRDEQKAVFSGNPELESEFGSGKAETFNIFLVENNIDKIEFTNDCSLKFSFKEGEEQDNWLKSDALTIEFEDKKPSNMFAEGSVSYSIISEEEKRKSKEYSENRSSSEYIEIVFTDDNELAELIQKEKIKGTYLFKSAPKKSTD